LLVADNILLVRIRADIGRRAGLSSLFIGPHEDVYALYLYEYRVLAVGSLFVMGLSFVVGVVALALWMTQVSAVPNAARTREPLYLWAAVAELCWALGVSNFVTEKDWIPWPWSGILIFMTTPAWATAMSLFCMEVAGWVETRWSVWLRYWLVALLFACFAGTIAQFFFGSTALFTAWYIIFGATYLVFGALFTLKAIRSSSVEHRLVAIAVLVNVAVGVYDAYVLRISPDYKAYTLLRYASVLFGASLFFIVIARFRNATRRAGDLVASMATRIALKEQELAEIYGRHEQQARLQERTLERTRILRDMHDGVGAHISTAIRQLQSGKANSDNVLGTMRDALDHLKLTVDALNLPEGNIAALLGSMRYRLDSRIADTGISLQWTVEQVPVIPSLNAQAMRQVQYMVFEALSNVLQHSNASILRVELVPYGLAGATLRIMDNGKGFDMGGQNSGAFKSLRQRATSIGATLKIDSAPTSTMIEITFT
jgi:signal transduction histidine kinase